MKTDKKTKLVSVRVTPEFYAELEEIALEGERKIAQQLLYFAKLGLKYYEKREPSSNPKEQVAPLSAIGNKKEEQHREIPEIKG